MTRGHPATRLGVLIFALSTAGCGFGSHPLVGKPAPAIENVTLLDGGALSLKEHLGSAIVVLDFWATWCPPCRESMPQVARAARRFADKGVVFYAVNIQETPYQAKSFLKSIGLECTVAMDRDGRVTFDYLADAIPQTVVIDRAGVVRHVYIGAYPSLEKTLANDIDALLREAPTAASS